MSQCINDNIIGVRVLTGRKPFVVTNLLLPQFLVPTAPKFLWKLDLHCLKFDGNFVNCSENM